MAPLVPVLFLAPLLGIAAPFGLARGPGAWLVVAVAGAVIFAIVLRRPALRAARTLRGRGEGGAAPEAAMTADVLGLLTAIDAGRDPWRSAAERGRLAATCTRVARTAERLPDGVRTGSRVVRAGMRAQCAALAAELDRCAGLFAAPDAAAREELQEALARILAAVATGRWGEGARGVAAEARAARRGAAAALAVGVGGAAAGIALGLPTSFTAVFAAVALASIWGVLDPRWGERLREALRIVRGKGD